MTRHLPATQQHPTAIDAELTGAEDIRRVSCALSSRDRAAVAARRALPQPRLVLVHSAADWLRLRVEHARDGDVVRVAAYLRTQPGVVRVVASPVTRSVRVRLDGGAMGGCPLTDLVRGLRISALPSAGAELPRASAASHTAFGTIVLAAVASRALGPYFDIPAVALTAIPSVRRAIAALREGRANVDLLDVVAVATSLATSRCTTAAFMTWLLGIGDLVLERTMRRARASIRPLLSLEASRAWRRTPSGQVERVVAGDLRSGDRVVVYPGERLPADGLVVEGKGVVDQRALTGESQPSTKRRGDRVLAATVLADGQLELVVERAGAATAAARLVAIVQSAGAKPMTLQRSAERVADRLVLPTIAVGVAAAAITGQVDRMTSVLITDFGTGLRITIPTLALVAMTLAARERILIKGGQFLERLARTDTVVFDKTGTLTRGDPEVLEVSPIERRAADEVLALAAAAEAHQGHPAAKALRRYVSGRALPVPVEQLQRERPRVGKGIVARVAGHQVIVGRRQLLREFGIDLSRAESVRIRHRAWRGSSLYVAIDGRLEALVAYADPPRPESAAVVQCLRGTGRTRRTIMLMSGDGKRNAQAIGARVGVDEVLAELLPEEKAKRIHAMQREGHVVAMVGDGINDAPALSLADVGLSLRGGTEAAFETADVVLLEGGLARLPRAFELADTAMRRIHRSLAIVIVPNAIAIVLGALGWISPATAAAINNGSTVISAIAAVAPLLKRPPAHTDGERLTP